MALIVYFRIGDLGGGAMDVRKAQRTWKRRRPEKKEEEEKEERKEARDNAEKFRAPLLTETHREFSIA